MSQLNTSDLTYNELLEQHQQATDLETASYILLRATLQYGHEKSYDSLHSEWKRLCKITDHLAEELDRRETLNPDL